MPQHSKVKILGAPIQEPPAPSKVAEIQGQGSIPYAQCIEEATPNTAVGKKVTGQKRGMGAAVEKKIDAFIEWIIGKNDK
jgi:hypothetical protein